MTKQTYYGFYLDVFDAILTFETKKEAEENRQNELDNSDEPMDDQISEVFPVYMTEEEFKNRIEV